MAFFSSAAKHAKHQQQPEVCSVSPPPQSTHQPTLRMRILKAALRKAADALVGVVPEIRSAGRLVQPGSASKARPNSAGWSPPGVEIGAGIGHVAGSVEIGSHTACIAGSEEIGAGTARITGSVEIGAGTGHIASSMCP
eukprot:366527-Chlamydomonas_euryale.AAC.2